MCACQTTNLSTFCNHTMKTDGQPCLIQRDLSFVPTQTALLLSTTIIFQSLCFLKSFMARATGRLFIQVAATITSSTRYQMVPIILHVLSLSQDTVPAGKASNDFGASPCLGASMGPSHILLKKTTWSDRKPKGLVRPYRVAR